MLKNVVIIGAGPAGYSAAFRLADNNINVTLIDTRAGLGGTCLYEGCIPSKSLLHTTSAACNVNNAPLFYGNIKINKDILLKNVSNIIRTNAEGLKKLAECKNISFIQGTAKIGSNNTVEVQKFNDEVEILKSDVIVIATGSSPSHLPCINLSSGIWTSSDAISMDTIPNRFLVIGAGYIGMELATIYARLGSLVTIIEMEEQMLPGIDSDLLLPLKKSISPLFKNIYLNSKVNNIEYKNNSFDVKIETSAGLVTDTFDRVLLSVGRRADTNALGNINIDKDNHGFIKTSNFFETSLKGIYAIGDVRGNPLLAHKASKEGILLAEHLLGRGGSPIDVIIPSVVYTEPEIATVGKTLKSIKEEGIDYQILRFPWSMSGRAVAEGNTNGLTRIVVEPKSGKILGAGITGAHAGELISQLTLAIKNNLTVYDLEDIVQPHPTFSETISECAAMFEGRCLYIHHHKKGRLL